MNRITSEPQRPIRPRRSIEQMLEDTIRADQQREERPQRPIRNRRSLEELEQAAIQETARIKQEEEDTLTAIKKEIEQAQERAIPMDEQISRGFQWLQGFTEGTKTVKDDTNQLMIETYFVKEIFDEVSVKTSILSHKIKEESLKLEDQEEKLTVTEFIDNNQEDDFLKYIHDDNELVKVFNKLPTARTLAQYLNIKLKEAEMDKKISNYMLIANNKRIKFKKYTELLSVYVDKRDDHLKRRLLSYSNLFIDINELISIRDKKYIDEFQNDQKWYSNYDYRKIWTDNYVKFKNIGRIIVYDCDFTYPIEWLQPQDKENIAIQARPLVKQKGKEYYYRRPKDCHSNDIRHGEFHHRSKLMKNEITIVHDVLNFFLFQGYVEIDYGLK